MESTIVDVEKSSEDLSNWFEMAGEKNSSKSEYRSIENMHFEEREKRLRKYKYLETLRQHKHSNRHMRVWKTREQWAEKIWKMAETS